MMRLDNLSNTYNRQRKTRSGRGDSGRRGYTCGRGTKGAGARSGVSRREYFEGGQMPLIRRLPKRGFKNPNHKEFSTVNVKELEEAFATGEQVDESVLAEKGMIVRKPSGLKVLGDGELSKALNVKATKFSATAKQKIEGAGGQCLSVET